MMQNSSNNLHRKQETDLEGWEVAEKGQVGRIPHLI